jgi:polysaccharide pyruvyl transferase CsaB
LSTVKGDLVMAEYLVSGYYGDNNAGDEAILAGIIRSIRELDPEATFTVISLKAARTRAIHGVKAVSRNDFQNTWRAIGQADLLISGGGSLLQDVTSTKSLVYYLGIMTMGRLQRTPVMVYAQGIGPITRPVGRLAVPRVFNGVAMITVRDQESAQTLSRLGAIRPDVTVTADAALALGPSDPDWGAALLREAGVSTDRLIVGVSVRPWHHGGGDWQEPLAQALDRIAVETGGQVVFVPMQQPNDVRVAQSVAARMSELAIVVQGEITHTHIQAMVARCDLLVGMRYHALVFAAMNGVPLVGLSYDPKNDSFLRAVGEAAAGRTAGLSADGLVAAARHCLERSAEIRARLLLRIADLTPLSRRNAELAVQVVQKRRTVR